MVYRPVDAAASRELARKVRSLEAQIAVLRRGAAHIALSEQLAGIKGAIKQLEPCLIDNFGEDRMAILEQLAALQKSVEDMQEVVDAQAGQLSTLNNTVQSVSASAEKAGWVHGRMTWTNTQTILTSSYDYPYYTHNIYLGTTNKRRFFMTDRQLIESGKITIKEARLMVYARPVTDSMHGCKFRWGSDLSANTAYSDSGPWDFSVSLGAQHETLSNNSSNSNLYMFEIPETALPLMQQNGHSFLYTLGGSSGYSYTYRFRNQDKPYITPIYGGGVGSIDGLWVDYWYTWN